MKRFTSSQGLKPELARDDAGKPFLLHHSPSLSPPNPEDSGTSLFSFPFMPSPGFGGACSDLSCFLAVGPSGGSGESYFYLLILESFLSLLLHQKRPGQEARQVPIHHSTRTQPRPHAQLTAVEEAAPLGWGKIGHVVARGARLSALGVDGRALEEKIMLGSPVNPRKRHKLWDPCKSFPSAREGCWELLGFVGVYSCLIVNH